MDIDPGKPLEPTRAEDVLFKLSDRLATTATLAVCTVSRCMRMNARLYRSPLSDMAWAPLPADEMVKTRAAAQAAEGWVQDPRLHRNQQRRGAVCEHIHVPKCRDRGIGGYCRRSFVGTFAPLDHTVYCSARTLFLEQANLAIHW
jgi:hypothetical protein